MTIDKLIATHQAGLISAQAVKIVQLEAEIVRLTQEIARMEERERERHTTARQAVDHKTVA